MHGHDINSAKVTDIALSLLVSNHTSEKGFPCNMVNFHGDAP